MKAYPIYIVILLIICLSFIQARNIELPNRYSANVYPYEPEYNITINISANNSLLWDGNAWSDTRWLDIDGSNAITDLDLQGYSIQNILGVLFQLDEDDGYFLGSSEGKFILTNNLLGQNTFEVDEDTNNVVFDSNVTCDYLKSDGAIIGTSGGVLIENQLAYAGTTGVGLTAKTAWPWVIINTGVDIIGGLPAVNFYNATHGRGATLQYQASTDMVEVIDAESFRVVGDSIQVGNDANQMGTGIFWSTTFRKRGRIFHDGLDFVIDNYKTFPATGATDILLNQSTRIRGDLNVSGNITSNNVFIPQYIFSHTNRTIPVLGVDTWTNVSFDQEDSDVKKGISHTYNNNLNHTFTIMNAGVYEVSYNMDIEDTSVSASDIDVAVRMVNSTNDEILGSVFETDITKQGVEVELQHQFLMDCSVGDVLYFQFIAGDSDVQISTHGAYGDHPESASIVIKKVDN